MKKIRGLLASAGGADFMSSLTAVVIGLFAGFLILAAVNPPQALGGLTAILTGGFSGMRNIGQVLYFATPIIMTGLSVGFAGKTGLFNIGASGQYTVGAFAAIYIGVRCDFLPPGLHCAAALAGAAAAGALWGAIPGVLKAWRNVNEVIACIMTNYIGMYLVNHLITQTILDSRYNQTMRVSNSANLPKLGLDKIFRSGGSVSSVNGGFLIAVASAVLLYFVLEKTKLGYELKACGFNRDAARYAGINEKRGIVLSMAVAGTLAGLGGALTYLAGSGSSMSVVDMLAAEGFTGIPVALLGFNSPIGIIFSGLLISYLTVGSFNMQLYNFSPQIIEIIIAIIIYFSAFSLLLKGLLGRLLRRPTAGKRRLKEPPPEGSLGGDAP